MRVPPLLWLVLLPLMLGAAEPRKLTVEAGEFERHETFVPFPNELPAPCVLREPATREEIILQNGAHGGFVLPALGKGERKTYDIDLAAKVPPRVRILWQFGVGRILDGEKPMLTYQGAPGPVPDGVPEHFRHGAHLHPVFTPAGRIVTGNHPPDHRWHRGIWFAWTKTDFEGRHPDFWNMGKEKDGKLTGEVRFTALKRREEGPVRAILETEHAWLDHTSGASKEILKETWRIAATPLPRAHVFDLISTQTVTALSALNLPKYFYGGLGLRGPAAWDPLANVALLTSEGLDRKTGDNSKARWVRMSGEVDGESAGIAVLIHPENFRFPQPLRLNPKNPQLCVAPSQEGDWSIEPGGPYISKYRFVVTDGAVDPAMLERAWTDYAHPPKVTAE